MVQAYLDLLEQLENWRIRHGKKYRIELRRACGCGRTCRPPRICKGSGSGWAHGADRKAQGADRLPVGHAGELDPQWQAWYDAHVPEFSGWLSAGCDAAVAVIEARVNTLKDHNNIMRLFCPNCNKKTDYTPFRTAAGITVLACGCGDCQDPIDEYSRDWDETRRDLLTSMNPF